LSAHARKHIIERIEKKLGFSFKVKDLSPELRTQIRLSAKNIDEATKLQELIADNKKKARARQTSTSIWFIFGSIFMIGILDLRWGYAFIGLVLWGIAFWNYRGIKSINDQITLYDKDRQDKLAIVTKCVSELTPKVNEEITLLHKARTQPTIRHIHFDFSSIIQAAKGKSILLEKIECPYCNGAVKLPKSGEFIECQYCGRIIYAANIFEKLKDVLGIP